MICNPLPSRSDTSDAYFSVLRDLASEKIACLLAHIVSSSMMTSSELVTTNSGRKEDDEILDGRVDGGEVEAIHPGRSAYTLYSLVM